ncbi:MAG: hypothetical protein IPK22_06670 [Verrucomicrobiaceae bacterium]|nr:hypothetical protein [Verrucomicrobiaceae bacterium]
MRQPPPSTHRSPAQSVDRLFLQLGGATTTLTTLGYDGSTSLASFISGLPPGTANQPGAVNGSFGTLADHDYVNVGGMLTLTGGGRFVVSTTNSDTPVFGDLFNLLDWTTLSAGTWNIATDLQLPMLSSGQFWDTSLFNSSGVIIAVHEPSRAMLVLLGLLGLCLRRRRQA